MNTLLAFANVVWGDLIAPRGFAYAALAIALAYSVAVIRARRVYERFAYNNRIDYSLADRSGFTPERELSGQIEDLLLNEPLVKLRVIYLWLAAFLGLLSVQAHLLAVQTGWSLKGSPLFEGGNPNAPNEIYEVSGETYLDLRNLLAVLAIILVIMWAITHWLRWQDGLPVSVRLHNWWHGLVDSLELQEDCNGRKIDDTPPL